MNRRAVYTALLAFLVAASVYAGKSAVQGKDVELLSSPDPLADAVGKLAYKQEVELINTQGSYTQVKTADGKTGWVATSALDSSLFGTDLMAGEDDAKTGVTGNEAAAATKGFTAGVESAFKNKNPNISFAEVDRVEKIVVTTQDKKEFIKEGAVGTAGGAK